MIHRCNTPAIRQPNHQSTLAAGKVVFEVFQDFTPLPARAFINRCQQGSTSTVQGTVVHKVLPGMGIYLGRNPRWHSFSHNARRFELF